MDVVASDRHLHHQGHHELIDGEFRSPFESPERAQLVLGAVRDAGVGTVHEPTAHGLDPVRRVHAPDLVDFLARAWDLWSAQRGPIDALPLCWPTPDFRTDRVPRSIDGLLSFYSFDAGTPITAGTWDAVQAAVDVALTACDLVRGGAPAAFALCRPPGHHAAARTYGGYCYLNNAAIAAQALRDGGAERVAVLDVDYHHGNGTQSIFYERADVVTASLHADPADEYPFFLGFADEVGAGEGAGANRNLPLPLGTDGPAYLDALDEAVAWVRAQRPDALVVPLGVDTHVDDPIAELRLTSEDFIAVGARLAGVGVPTVLTLEGGYALASIGRNVANTLIGFAEAS
jgi:acetoin utilization deacetylase AcuC-like enzyme